jgi:hypothetical protein
VFRVVLVISMVVAGFTGAISAADLDIGSEIPHQPATVEARDILCVDPYYFGGNSESFSGTDRMRGNIYTLTAADTLTEITVELDFAGSADLYFYVLEAAAIDATYTVVSETVVPSTSVGQAYYSSGEISVPLNPGTFYAIGAAWGPETVTYVRDPAALPRTWALGNVEATAQGSGITPPLTGDIVINPFPGAEYSMTLCFGPVPVELQKLTLE